MAIYIFIALITGGFGFIEVFGQEKYSKYKPYVLFLFTLFLIWFVGFRECGFDYENYSHYFDLLHTNFWKSNAEFLVVEKPYALLNYMLPSLTAVYVVFAILTCGIMSVFLYKNSPYPFYSYFLLLGVIVYISFMGQYRQGLAIPLVLVAFSCKERMQRILLIALASCIHVSAILGLLVFVIPNRILKGKYYVLLLGLALVSNLTLLVVFRTQLGSLSGFIASKLSYYMSEEEGLVYGINLAMLLRLASFCIFYKYRSFIQQNPNGILYFNIYFLSLLIYLGLGFLPQLSGRGSLYFYVMEVVVATILLKNLRTSSQVRGCIFFFFTAIALYRQMGFLLGESGESYIPYKNALFNIF